MCIRAQPRPEIDRTSSPHHVLFCRRSQMEAMTQTTKPDATRRDNGLDLTLRAPVVRGPCLANPRKPNQVSEDSMSISYIDSHFLPNPPIDRPICAHFGRRRAKSKWRCKGVPSFLSYSGIRYNKLGSPFFWGACNCLHKNETRPAFFVKNRVRRVKTERCMPR
jgi:hypothetical protein